MEVSFLKDAIDRVAEMAKPFTFEFAGRQFCSAELHEIRPEVDFPARYSVDTLDEHYGQPEHEPGPRRHRIAEPVRRHR